ncbi:MAG: D-alanyl-D-alanine carboxypeptidase/D-alanyl-D-alanine-endopeptidase [Acidimicrobiales bacterium]
MRRLILPLLLLIVAGVAAFMARSADRDAAALSEPAESSPLPSAVTPVLSARRIPEFIRVDTSNETLATDLVSVVESSPENSCLVVTSEGDEVFNHNGQLPLVPASAQKLVTGTAALEELGGDYVFETIAGTTSAVSSGVIEGDLWLVGGGDPILTTKRYAGRYPEPETFTDLAELADALVAVGITEIQGGVIGDESRYDVVRSVPSWPPRFIDQNQTGPLSALSVNDGFDSYPDDNHANQLATSSSQPATNSAKIFDDLLEERGVVIRGGSSVGEVPSGLFALAKLQSPPLTEVVGQMLASSDNSTAELLLKEIGLQARQDGSTTAGAEASGVIMTRAGFKMAGVVVADGSGLSSDNSVTCELLIDLLDDAGPDSALAAGLAISGQSGTLRERFLAPGLAGRIRAKTGSLNEVSALAGFAEGAEGDILTFAYIVNQPELSPDRARVTQDGLGKELVEYPEGPELNQLAPKPVNSE